MAETFSGVSMKSSNAVCARSTNNCTASVTESDSESRFHRIRRGEGWDEIDRFAVHAEGFAAGG